MTDSRVRSLFQLSFCVGLTILASSCASTGGSSVQGKFARGSEGNASVKNAIFRQEAQQKNVSGKETANPFHNATQSKPADQSQEKSQSTQATIRLMSAEMPIAAESQIQQTSGVSHCPNPYCEEGASCPACRRGIPIMIPAIPVPPSPTMIVDNTPYPEEYLCDGGDRGLPVHYDSLGRQGLDTEDTIAEYQDHTGEREMKVSNKVCVYAPSFGTVRNVSQSVSNTSVDKVLGAHELMLGSNLKSKLEPFNSRRTKQANKTVVRSRPSQYEAEQIDGLVGQRLQLGNHKTLAGAYEELGKVYPIRADGKTSPISMGNMTAALSWSRKQNPVISAVSTGGNEVYAFFGAASITGLDKEESKGELKIQKSANVAEAKQGETVTFTIEYHNWGDRELTNVRILDNLTPRLEFIPGSVKSDIECETTVSDNGEGSVVLQWALKNDLPGHATGTISFQCRVK